MGVNYDEYDDDDEFEYDTDNSGGGLRKQLEDTLKRAQAAEKRATKAEAENKRIVAESALKEKGIPAKVVKFMQADDIDLSDDKAIDGWLEDNKDVFNLSPSTPDDDEHVVEDEDEQPDPGFSRVGALRDNARPGAVTKFQQVSDSLPEDASPEDVFKAYADSGF